MDTKAIEKFSIQAREQLLKDMEQQLYVYALDDAGRTEYGADADAVRGTVLSPAERAQRTELFRLIERDGALPFITTMAYTWFNRFAAIRYMELAGYLPSHVRMLSAADGAFNPECLRVATTLNLPELDQAEVMRLIQAGDDEKLYRHILLAQCNQLAAFLPSVFGTVAADALTLPQNLLAKTELNVLYRLVADIPEDAWRDVEILGWMYQFYNSEVKAEFFKSKRKAGADDIAPATQLFTPDWIVRYMVDNSLGRLWMLNHPESILLDYANAENPSDRLMEYYIEPDEEHEDFIRIASPEDITFCDPACGSGHILVYAFKMLMAIYEECGYREREIPGLILTKNLAGFEIDERAAQIAQLALAMCARKHDRRFFTRNVTANICVLSDIDIDQNELNLMSPLRDRPELLEELAHLGEIGSLLVPSADDIEALEGDVAESNTGNLFTSKANENVERALTACKALRRRFDVVVANPPYMGSSSFNPFMSKWVKKRYPDSCKDLCTAFIERGLALTFDNGYTGIITSDTCMYLSSFEKLRNKIIDAFSIVSLLDTRGTNAHPDVFDANAVWLLAKERNHAYKGSFFKLNQRIGSKASALLEAIQNPDCGWLYRADASGFHDIPGSPIAYWASEAIHKAFCLKQSVSTFADVKKGLTTANDRLYVRLWHEVSLDRSSIVRSGDSAIWVPLNKGGEFRRWYGNNEYFLNWGSHGAKLKADSNAVIRNEAYFFHPSVTWNDITSGKASLRWKDSGHIFNDAGPSIFASHSALLYLLAALNSSTIELINGLVAPTIHFTVGQMSQVPLPNPSEVEATNAEHLAESCIALSKADWDSQETSWDFKRNPLV
ncbi:BREX-1 system adenine-specific DNA-methyltransferase PglX [Enorma phocaeensis]|uniref:BREX-1 system adenine-specific DNA-methyltransferase PglX n=1 Tax=Enorma phocaeensis TaxID=1871019 RepID=UPI002355C564|nr:BREX-1 system adenine-specific DNA-methyltransferase PglX [Enorma phocaeensis]